MLVCDQLMSSERLRVSCDQREQRTATVGPLQSHRKTKLQQEVSLAMANVISMAAAMETVLSEADGTFVGLRFSW